MFIATLSLYSGQQEASDTQMLLCVWQGMTADIFRKYMSVDKKVLDGALRLILLRGPLGSCTFTGDFDAQVLDQTLDAFCRS